MKLEGVKQICTLSSCAVREASSSQTRAATANRSAAALSTAELSHACQNRSAAPSLIAACGRWDVPSLWHYFAPPPTPRFVHHLWNDCMWLHAVVLWKRSNRRSSSQSQPLSQSTPSVHSFDLSMPHARIFFSQAWRATPRSGAARRWLTSQKSDLSPPKAAGSVASAVDIPWLGVAAAA